MSLSHRLHSSEPGNRDSSIDPIELALGQLRNSLLWNIWNSWSITTPNYDTTNSTILLFHDLLTYEDALRLQINQTEKAILEKARYHKNKRWDRDFFFGMINPDKHFALIQPFISDISRKFQHQWNAWNMEMIEASKIRTQKYLNRAKKETFELLDFLCDMESCGEQELEITFWLY